MEYIIGSLLIMPLTGIFGLLYVLIYNLVKEELTGVNIIRPEL